MGGVWKDRVDSGSLPGLGIPASRSRPNEFSYAQFVRGIRTSIAGRTNSVQFNVPNVYRVFKKFVPRKTGGGEGGGKELNKSQIATLAIWSKNRLQTDKDKCFLLMRIQDKLYRDTDLLFTGHERYVCGLSAQVRRAFQRNRTPRS